MNCTIIRNKPNQNPHPAHDIKPESNTNTKDGIKWVTSWKNLLLPYANNKSTNQPAHPPSLISAFVVRCLDSINPLVSISKMSSLYLASVAGRPVWVYPVQTPKTGFLVMRLKYNTKQAERKEESSFPTYGHLAILKKPTNRKSRRWKEGIQKQTPVTTWQDSCRWTGQLA